ncbi:MAG: hypothetical protein J5919_02040 [Clostridia bacterium]|nr:hypothetical protein [Clostridia bacterium]
MRREKKKDENPLRFPESGLSPGGGEPDSGQQEGSSLRFYRIIIIAAIFIAVCAVYAVSLFRAVLAPSGADETDETEKFTEREVAIQAVRGEIYDRNGVPLVTNKYTYRLRLDYMSMPSGFAAQNEAIAGIMDIVDLYLLRNRLEESGCPLQGTYPRYNYDLEMLSGSLASGRFERIREFLQLPEDVSASDFAAKIASHYRMLDPDGKPLYSDERMTDLIRIRYEMEAIRFSKDEPYPLLSDIGLREITAFLESGIPCVEIYVTYSREYAFPGYASHILGRIGKIQAENAEYYTSQGYPVTAVVGIDGCEKAFEEYLRGMDGVMIVTEDSEGNVVKTEIKKPAEPGYDIRLTIDIDLQIAAEHALSENIDYVIAEAAKSGKQFEGEDCDCGAMVVERIGTGELLAVASFPTYDLTTFGADYADLTADSRRPLFNRALNGTYACGSTFKVGMAVGALTDGTLMSDGKPFTSSTLIMTEGKYRYYEDYQPECWVYAYGHAKHGLIDVTKAIQVSCNCFFYELGRLMEIENINKYCRLYGLGQPTGIELDESVGVLADADYTARLGVAWTGGLTISTAIGQGYNRFTPIQLANYTCTVIDGGTRYSLRMLKDVRKFTGEIVFAAEPEIAASFSMTSSTLETIRNAMSKVVDENTAVTAFDGFAVKVGGKTGSAQVTGQSNNALFISFAPLESPEIAVACVLERGAHGANAAMGTRLFMEKYFGLE